MPELPHRVVDWPHGGAHEHHRSGPHVSRLAVRGLRGSPNSVIVLRLSQDTSQA